MAILRLVNGGWARERTKDGTKTAMRPHPTLACPVSLALLAGMSTALLLLPEVAAARLHMLTESKRCCVWPDRMYVFVLLWPATSLGKSIGSRNKKDERSEVVVCWMVRNSY